MHDRDLPCVRDGVLRLTTSASDKHAPALVGSAEWYDVLEQIDSFRFEDRSGCSFTARREQRKRGWYWYAYCNRGKKLRKVYLGKADQLELARLQAAAHAFANLPVGIQYTRPPAGVPRAEQVADDFAHLTKLRIPPTPGNLLQRPRLTQQLNRSFRSAPAAANPQPTLTVISAPAGYGKTTLLAEWLATRTENRGLMAEPKASELSPQSLALGTHVAWLTLDPSDNDSRQFWRCLIAALQTSVPQLGRQALLLLQGAHPSATRAAVAALLDDLQQLSRPVVLVLDDYHSIDTPAIHDSLAALLTHCPARLHVVISSRTPPPLPFGRLRLRSDVTEIQTPDLRLTDAEVFALLSCDPRLADNQSASAAVLRMADGWIAGVNLLLLALQRQGDLETALAAIDGSHPYLTEYFIEHVWQRQSPPIQAFLLHTSILENLGGSLCAAVTALPNGQQLLAEIAQANLFLIASDQSSGWYRYHPLFAQALRRLLEQVHPDEVAILHRRAAQWFVEHQAIGDALRHMVAGRCFDQVAELLEQHALPMLQGGDVASLLNALRQLPLAVLHERPALREIKTRTLMLAGELNALEAWLEQLESNGAPENIWEGSAAIRATIGDTTSLGEGAAWEGLDAFTLSMHAWTQNDTQASCAAAARAVRAGQVTGFRSISLLAGGTMACIQVISGRLSTGLRIAHKSLALDHTTEAAVLAGSHQPNPATGPIFLALGLIYYERNRLALAQQCMEKALDLAVQLGRADYLFAMHAFLARTLVAQRQRGAAFALIQTGVSQGREGRIPFWPEADVLAYQAWIWLHAGAPALAAEWAQMADVRAGDPQIARRRIEYWVYAEVLLAQGHYQQAASILCQLVLSATQSGARTEPLIKLLIACASALFAQGRREDALPVLARALDLGQAEGYIRPFLDIAPRHTRALLEYYHQKTRAEAHIETYVQLLLAESEQVPFTTIGPAGDMAPAMALSQREREILRLVEGGLSNSEIAHKLVIEANTVKSHLHRIYQRLRVTTRYQAVMHAKSLQIL